MKKNGLVIGTLLIIMVFSFWTWVSFGNSYKLNRFVENEGSNIQEVFHMSSVTPIGKEVKVKSTQVKDLYEFRRYLFILPKAFIYASSIGEAAEIQKSFPQYCELYFHTYPKWLEMGFLKSLFGGLALIKCRQIGSKLKLETSPESP